MDRIVRVARVTVFLALGLFFSYIYFAAPGKTVAPGEVDSRNILGTVGMVFLVVAGAVAREKPPKTDSNEIARDSAAAARVGSASQSVPIARRVGRWIGRWKRGA
jgi:hypothetical protein